MSVREFPSQADGHKISCVASENLNLNCVTRGGRKLFQNMRI